MQNLSYPDHWFRDIKKIYVIESVDYYTRKGSTTIVIRYKSWWRIRRKLKFARTRTTHNNAEMHEQSPKAQAVLAKIKESMDPTYKRGLFEQESPMAALKSVLPAFSDVPRFWGWPTKR